MKLRIRGNSIRLRLTQSEVRRLADAGSVEESTDFGGGRRFGYSLCADDVPAPAATFDGGALLVRLPRDVARRWADGDEVGIESSQPAGEGATLKILVEKDFVCIDGPPDENQDDAFPNPRGASCDTSGEARSAAASE